MLANWTSYIGIGLKRTYTEPGYDMGVGGIASAAGVLLVTSRLDQNRVVDSS